MGDTVHGEPQSPHSEAHEPSQSEQAAQDGSADEDERNDPSSAKMPPPPPPAATARGTHVVPYFSGPMESPVLLPLAPVSDDCSSAPAAALSRPIAHSRISAHVQTQQVEPSPSTSLMSYPLPLFAGGAAGSRMPFYPAYDKNGAPMFMPYAYPQNFIAPSRNRQARKGGIGCWSGLGSRVTIPRLLDRPPSCRA